VTVLFIVVTRFSTGERVRVNVATVALYEDTDCQGMIRFVTDIPTLYTEESAKDIDLLIKLEKGEIP
jgi:hypothetical protein